MYFEKALSILGLQRNYTDEELKKAYRKLIVKYHPDKWEGKTEAEKKKAEEKTKEINAAKEFLEKYNGQRAHTYTNNNNNYYSNAAHNYVAFVQAKAKFITEMNQYDYELVKLVELKILTLKEQVQILFKINQNYKNITRNIKNIHDLNNNIIKRKGEIWKILEKFAKDYCRKNDINIDISKLEKYSLKKLYEELEKLRKEQNGITTKLNKKQEEYELYAGYNVIKENIEIIKAEIIREYNEGLITEDKAITTFEKKILKEFGEYYRRLEIINNFKNLGYKDIEIRAIIALMEENITADKKIFKIYEQKATNIIAGKETKKSTTKTFNIYKEYPKYNNNYRLKKNYYIKHDESEKPKYKIKKNI